jgi:hypothetical protein
MLRVEFVFMLPCTPAARGPRHFLCFFLFPNGQGYLIPASLRSQAGKTGKPSRRYVVHDKWMNFVVPVVARMARHAGFCAVMFTLIGTSLNSSWLVS